MTGKNGHGGSRSGAGRPRGEKGVAKGNAFVAKKVRGLAEDGWEVLAESYPDLMRTAIEEAVGKGETKKPNIPMLKTLIELLPKLAGSEEEEQESLVSKLLKDHLDRVAGKASDDAP